MSTPAIVSAMAALEEWLVQPGDDRRVLSVEYADKWRASVALGHRVAEHSGVTMADALAQAAQVVVSDPHKIGGAA